MSTASAVPRRHPRTAREPIEQAALELLESGGPAAVTTRAVAAAAGVQAVAIYRSYGDMDGLLEAVVDRGFAAYLAEKTGRARSEDPMEDLRQGWDLHVGFGTAHPHVYALMYGRPDTRRPGAAVAQAEAVLHGLVEAIARAGRLRIDVPSAARAVHAAGRGVTLSLIETPQQDRDPKLSHRVREAVLAAITTSRGGERVRDGGARARYATALAATLADDDQPLTQAESQLLVEWLHRLAASG